MAELTGSCCCKAVRYRVNGEIQAIVNCHCGLCRKMNGAPFSTYVVVAQSAVEMIYGELREHEITERSTRSICTKCGTPIQNSNSQLAGLTILHYGSIDTPPGLIPGLNIYCESKLKWLDDLAQLKNFEQGIGSTAQ